jgi:hypothetical protein
MSTDITRRTFDPANHYSRVVMQQGRVALDADWNEQSAILLHYMRTLASDIIGRCAGPADHLGFEILTAADPDWETRFDALAAGDVRYKAFKPDVKGGNLLICPGRYYVDGILVENDAPALYDAQLGFPFNDGITLDVINRWDDAVLLYLKVCEREITYVQDDRIREVALGGPDTSARTKTCWQVVALPKPAKPEIKNFGCSFVETLPPLGLGTLRARARQPSMTTSPCITAPDARYRGLENHLYRVEIHQSGEANGDAKGATFKFSRDNGAAVFPIRAFGANSVEVESLGRDRRFGLASGDWVEVVNDRIAAGGKAGPLFAVEKACNDSLTVTLIPGTDAASALGDIVKEGAALHPMLRRWDHAGDAKFAGALAVTTTDEAKLAEGWIELEDGVLVRFAPGVRYEVGDFWQIEARVATGDVYWPLERDAAGALVTDVDKNPVPATAKRHGPHCHYAPLLLIGPDGKKDTVSDCRCRITPICPPQPAPVVDATLPGRLVSVSVPIHPGTTTPAPADGGQSG